MTDTSTSSGPRTASYHRQACMVRGAPVADVVEAAALGSEAAWQELVERYVGLIRWVIRSFGLSSDDAADVTQATLTRLFEHLGRIHTPEHLAAWLVTTARNECRRLLRAYARRPVEHLDEGDPRLKVEAEHDHGLLAAERTEAVRRAMGHLPPRRRELLLELMADSAPDYRMISSRLDIPVGSIGPTRQRSLATLRTRAELCALVG